MELDAVDRKFAMAQAHDFLLLGPRGDFENRGKCLPLHEERMVARGLEGRRQPGEDSGAVVMDRRGLSVHEPIRAHDVTAVHVADTLVAEAHAEQRDRRSEAADDFARDARLVRRAGAGRNADARGLHRRDFVGRDFVVSLHERIRAEFAEILDEVVGEGVVVIDDEQHGLSGVLSVQCSVFSAQCSVLSVQCSVLSAQCSVLRVADAD